MASPAHRRQQDEALIGLCNHFAIDKRDGRASAGHGTTEVSHADRPPHADGVRDGGRSRGRLLIIMGARKGVSALSDQHDLRLEVEELEERIAPSITGQGGYEGQPGNQGNGQLGYEGQPGNQGG